MVSPRLERSGETQSLLNTPAPQPPQLTGVQKFKAFMGKYGWILFIVLGHCICAGGLTVVNKWALNHYDSAFTLTFVQLAFSAAAIQILGWIRVVKLEPLKIHKMVEYAPAAAMFYITVVASNKVIQLSSVNTFIVVRSTVPVVVAVMEHFVFRKNSTLNWMSAVALLVMTLGAFLYVQASGSIVMDGLDWIILYFVCMPVDALLIKRALNRIDLPPWSLALYNNLIAAMFMPLGAVLARQWEVFTPAAYTDLFAREVWLPILVSCVAAIGISFFQMNARHILTATAFMVLGVMNKLLTILLNKYALSDDGPLQALVGVFLAIAAGIFWQYSVADKSISASLIKPDPSPAREETPSAPLEDEEAPAEVAVPGAQTNQATSTTDLKKLETEEEEPHNCLQKCFEHPYTVVGVLFCVIGLENLIRWFIDPNGPTRMFLQLSGIPTAFQAFPIPIQSLSPY